MVGRFSIVNQKAYKNSKHQKKLSMETDESQESSCADFADNIVAPQTQHENGTEDKLSQDLENVLTGEVSTIKKRKSYANAFKMEAIELAEKIGNRKAAKQLGLDESNVREWRKRKSEIEKLPTHKRTRRHAKPKWLDLETQLAQWFLDRKSKNLYLTTNMVKEKGMELAMEYGYQDFTGSSGWVTRFMNRVRENGGNFNNYSSGGIGEQKSDNQNQMQPSAIPTECVERVAGFRSFFAEKRAQSELKRRNGIICLDEVPLSLDMPSVEGNFLHNNHQNDIGSIPPAEKVKFTIVLSVSASGGKLPPLVIFKLDSRKSSILPKEAILVFPDGIVVRTTNNGWINSHIIEDWIENCWKKWLWPSRSEDNVLILDSCKSHLSQEIKFKCSKHFQTTFIPRGMSQILNPLEITVISKFKQSIMRQWEHWVLDQACGTENNEEFKDDISRKVENFVTICQWIVEAWKDVNPQVIMNGFAKAGIESFSPDEVVEAILNESNDSSCEPDCTGTSLSNNNLMIFPDQENFVGDNFDGWTD